MTNKENAWIALRGGKPERVPCYYDSCQIMLCSAIGESPAPGQISGFDGYGVHQSGTTSAGGAYTPTPGYGPVITDIERWREQLVLPDPDSVDWEACVTRDAAFRAPDRENYLQDLFYGKGIFERLHFLMGFEEALISIMTEPEEVYGLVGAIADNKIKHIEKIARWYKPDILTWHDDFAHQNGLFFSPEIFREIFKPHLKRIVDAAHSEGLFYKQHCCGKWDALAEDFAELGIDAMDPVQPMNDMNIIRSAFGGHIGIVGGLDVQNVVDNDACGEKAVRAEVRRCIDSYAAEDGYMLYGASLHMYDPKSRAPGGRLFWVCDECSGYGEGR